VVSSSVPPIGARLRTARRHRGLSARGLAREIGVSASLISQIETDKSSPSVSTLYAITTALGISVEDLFGADASPADVAPEAGGESSAAALLHGADHRMLAPRRDRRLGPVVTPDQREVLTLDSGVTWELLGQVPHRHVDFLLITYHPGGCSSSSGALMRHSGTEFGYVISGALTLTLGFDTHCLVTGDAVSFDSSTPHAYRNESTEPAVGVWFVLEH
jgi:transcriptional regulator with XRE-family HTH domain